MRSNWTKESLAQFLVDSLKKNPGKFELPNPYVDDSTFDLDHVTLDGAFDLLAVAEEVLNADRNP